MRKLWLIGMLTGLAVGALPQGQVYLTNYQNPLLARNPAPTDTMYGLFWLDSDGAGPASPALINTDFNVSFYGGSDANNLVLLRTLVDSGGGAVFAQGGGGPGTFFDLSSEEIVIPGALTRAFFRIEAWIGGPNLQSATYSATSPVFENRIGNPYFNPPDIPSDFFEMPAMVLTAVPEPGTFALAGLGAVAFLMFGRLNGQQGR